MVSKGDDIISNGMIYPRKGGVFVDIHHSLASLSTFLLDLSISNLREGIYKALYSQKQDKKVKEQEA
ncbi:hypothetical protein DD595_24785 [Enterobacter cloacae complex sp. 4DZ3-17B2]|nr:hypothetical protein DD595_24785 [Enterobacter cloacae complex sp. 4DZ3-17B2]